jgi:hypothetical protein
MGALRLPGGERLFYGYLPGLTRASNRSSIEPTPREGGAGAGAVTAGTAASPPSADDFRPSAPVATGSLAVAETFVLLSLTDRASTALAERGTTRGLARIGTLLVGSVVFGRGRAILPVDAGIAARADLTLSCCAADAESIMGACASGLMDGSEPSPFASTARGACGAAAVSTGPEVTPWGASHASVKVSAGEAVVRERSVAARASSWNDGSSGCTGVGTLTSTVGAGVGGISTETVGGSGTTTSATTLGVGTGSMAGGKASPARASIFVGTGSATRCGTGRAAGWTNSAAARTGESDSAIEVMIAPASAADTAPMANTGISHDRFWCRSRAGGRLEEGRSVRDIGHLGTGA